MSIPIVIDWSAPADITICASQSGAAGSLIGSFPFYSKSSATSFAVDRHIRITSASNNAAVTFTLSGYDYLGNAITEDLTGPNATSVESVKSYAILSSIIASTNYTNIVVTVGFGGSLIIKLDSQRAVFNTAISFQKTNASAAGAISLYRCTNPIEIITGNGQKINPDLDFNDLASAGTATGQALTVPSFTGPTISGDDEYYAISGPATALNIDFATDATKDASYRIVVIQQGFSA